MYRSRGIFFPLLLVAIGLLALLVNLRVLDADRLVQLARLWPVLLILFGVELIIARSLPRRMVPFVNLALAVLVLGGAGAYAVLMPAGSATATQQRDVSDRIDGLTAGRLELSFGATSIDIGGGQLTDDLYRAHLEFRSSEDAPRVSLDRSNGTLRIQSGTQRTLIWPFDFASGANRVQLRLSDRVPWSFRISGGATQSTLDLTGLRLTGLDMTGGASKLEIRVPRPTGMVPIRVSGGVSSLLLQVAAGSAARINVSGGVSSVDVDRAAFPSTGDTTWETNGYAQAADRYDIRLSGGASRIQVVAR